MKEVPENSDLLFVSNQGGNPVVDFKLALAREVAGLAPSTRRRLAVLTEAQAIRARASAPDLTVTSFEEHRDQNAGYDLASERERLLHDYPRTDWSLVLLSERTFYDVSNLDGGAGERLVSQDYVERLLIELVRFFESVLNGKPELVVAQTPDTLMTLVLYNVTRERGVPIRGLSPAWITPDRKPAWFLTEDEFLHSPAMRRADLSRSLRSLTVREIVRADAFRKEILHFDANAVYKSVTGQAFGRSALSPNIKSLISYLNTNMNRRPEVEYYKIDPVRKFLANAKRFFRKILSSPMLGSRTVHVPERSVFFPLHFQPEATTLVGGIYYADQPALAEAVLKSLPLGWSLVVKEHPAGRGTRPTAHYRRLLRYPNVIFCDAPSKEILRHVDAVVTITGTIGIEALAMDRPVIMLGRWFWDDCPLVHQTNNVSELSALFRQILVDKAYASMPDREDQIRRFLLSYLDGLVPAGPRAESAPIYAKELLAEINRLRAEEKVGRVGT
ncbi:hypothetical protein [Parasphingorhabdus sp.]|jgi:hypothetical protein|uniref:capsular polysaccharide export protein, LipB/KpsS family n=1 Tax=Parasphingorhabdus sp. TaxID=2709688 RepID=UPI0032F00E0E